MQQTHLQKWSDECIMLHTSLAATAGLDCQIQVNSLHAELGSVRAKVMHATAEAVLERTDNAGGHLQHLYRHLHLMAWHALLCSISQLGVLCGASCLMGHGLVVSSCPFVIGRCRMPRTATLATGHSKQIPQATSFVVGHCIAAMCISNRPTSDLSDTSTL